MKAKPDPKQIEWKSVAVLLSLQWLQAVIKHKWADESHKSAAIKVSRCGRDSSRLIIEVALQHYWFVSDVASRAPWNEPHFGEGSLSLSWWFVLMVRLLSNYTFSTLFSRWHSRKAVLMWNREVPNQEINKAWPYCNQLFCGTARSARNLIELFIIYWNWLLTINKYCTVVCEVEF